MVKAQIFLQMEINFKAPILMVNRTAMVPTNGGTAQFMLVNLKMD